MKKIMKKSVPVLVAATIVIGQTVPALAAQTSSEKEEVIYIMTDENGNVENINAVNSFNTNGSSAQSESTSITDYGDYSDVKMLTTNDEISQSGDTITFCTDADKVYYQGTMTDQTIPWKIEIEYYMDGKQYSAADIAGMSGSLEIHFKITENEDYSVNTNDLNDTEITDADFYNNYALQAAFVLDTDKCTDIEAADGTLANVGSNKQISYIILPGKGIDTTITANVTDFEMDAVTINGIKLNLNVEIDDAELMDKVTQLMNATETLDGGAETLDDGVTTLASGISTLQDGLDQLNSQSDSLTGGSSEVLTALTTIQSSLSEVSMATDELDQLTSASEQILQGINELNTGIDSVQSSLGYEQYKAIMQANGLDIDTLQSANSDALIAQLSMSEDPTMQQLAQILIGYKAAVNGMDAYLDGFTEPMNSLSTGSSTLSTNYTAFNSKIGEMANSLSTLTVKMSQLSAGINQLVASYQTLDSGMNAYTDGVASIVAGYSQLVDGVSSLASGSQELAAGTSELYDQTDNLDSQVQDQINEMLSSIQGAQTETVSFVSSKNTNVDSVQFVIKTAAVEKVEEQTDTTQTTETMTFWQKLVSLFGL